MPELLMSAPNAAEHHSQYSDGCFQIVIGASGMVPPNWGELISTTTLPGFGASLTDSSPAHWVAKNFLDVDDGTPGHELGEVFVPAPHAQFIAQIRDDLNQLSASVRTSHSAELCRLFAEGVGIALANNPGARIAVFGDEEDGVTLVAHSRASKRQVSFEFGARGDTITIISIDEEMCRTERECHISHVLTLGNAIAWLNRR
ncbi:MAG: hypothetical protein AAB363_01625 [Planctomycetota bacterium]|jgi:hypothetical protein